jgi:transcriptional regulator with XRE-family HTH domain
MTQQAGTPQSFGSRVRQILEKKGMSHAEFAEKTGLTPPTVSKLLAEPTQREARIEDVFSFARVLETTPAELGHGTDVAELVAQYVPRSHVEAEARARADAQQALARMTAERDAQDAKIGSLETSATAMRAQIAKLSGDLQSAQADRVARNAKIATLERQLDEATQQAADRAVRLANASAQVQSLAQEVSKTKGESVGKAVVASLVSFVGGALLGNSGSRAPRSRSGRKPPSGGGKRGR